MQKPNIILFITDQQRYDSINANGYNYMKTPNIDRIVKKGTTFTECFCTAPSCVPSRASFFNGCYPHKLGVYHNFCEWKHSWVEQLNESGYHCVNIGKMHTVPYDAECGFDERFVVENKDRPLLLDEPHGGYFDEWDKFLLNNGVRKPSRTTYQQEYQGYMTALGAYEWPLSEGYHPDIFVGNIAKWFIEKRESNAPFFLEIGFPGPHPPYDPPISFIKQYEDAQMPLPIVSEEEIVGQPHAQSMYREEMIAGNHDAVKWVKDPSEDQLSRLRQYYAANVTLIDEKIGEIMDILERKGYLENSIVIFTSDHGDCLGDHGHIQKWTMYDSVVKVPMVISAPGILPQGEKIDALIQHMDIAATLMDIVGVKPPLNWDAISLLPQLNKGREYVFAEHSKDNILKDVDFITMIRSKKYKLVHYQDQKCGELYHLEKDPKETQNLWQQEEYQEIKQEMIEELLNWRINN